jgi:hypothetical protein
MGGSLVYDAAEGTFIWGRDMQCLAWEMRFNLEEALGSRETAFLLFFLFHFDFFAILTPS